MSAAEQLQDPRGVAPRDALLEEEAFIEAQLTQSPAKTGARLRPLLALAPYILRYRGRALLAFISLTIAAITTLVVPVAVRRMIDFGFSPEGIAMINRYFSVMIAVVAVLAGASASRHSVRNSSRTCGVTSTSSRGMYQSSSSSASIRKASMS